MGILLEGETGLFDNEGEIRADSWAGDISEDNTNSYQRAHLCSMGVYGVHFMKDVNIFENKGTLAVSNRVGDNLAVRAYYPYINMSKSYPPGQICPELEGKEGAFAALFEEKIGSFNNSGTIEAMGRAGSVSKFEIYSGYLDGVASGAEWSPSPTKAPYGQVIWPVMP